MPTHHALAKKKTTQRDGAKTLKKLLFHVFLFFVVAFFCTAIHWNVCVYAAMGKGKEESN